MKINRTKNAARNMVFGILLKLYQTVVPFAMRTVMICFLGVEYLGLNSLFVSVLQVLNLAELGVGSAMVFSMYKPIAEDDHGTICGLIKLYRTYYRVIGLVIAVIGTCLTPFIPKLIHGNIPPDMNVYILYLLNLGATVLSYWLFAYRNSLIVAHQRVDIVSKITVIANTIQYILQIIAVVCLKNYYLYVIILLLNQVIINIATAVASIRLFPGYKPNGDLPKETVKCINQRIRDLFTSKIGNIVVNSADSIVISAFLGLTVLAVYQNYHYISTSIIGFVTVIFNSCTAGIGNSIIVETKEKNFNDLKIFTFLLSWIAGLAATCYLCLVQPFMDMWVGKELMVGFSTVICFVIHLYIYEINALLNLYKDSAGMWHEDRFRPLVTAGVNLILNLLLVNYLGIYGVILCTVISMLLVGMPWILHNLFTVVFERKYMRQYVCKLLLHLIIVATVAAIAYFVCSCINLNDILTIIIRLIVCMIIVNGLYITMFRRFAEYNKALDLVDNLTKNKLKSVTDLLRRKSNDKNR